MKPFAHHRASSVAGAVSLLAAYEGRARVNGGGTDLLGVLKDEIHDAYPEALIDLKTIPGLDRIRTDAAGGLVVGALTRLADLAASPIVRERFPLLAEAARSVATPQIRNVATLGGNLCQEVRCWYYRYPRHVGGPIGCLRKGNGPCLAVKGDSRYHAISGGKGCFAVCPSDTAVALAALEAVVRIEGPHGAREVLVADLYEPSRLALGPDEVLTQVRIPALPADAGTSFVKFTVREPVDFAVVSVAALVAREGGACTKAQIALGGVAPGPVRAATAERVLVGRTVDNSAAALAAEAALAGAKPLRGNTYKVALAKSLVERTLLAAWS
ncbi:MAG: FAD binding domain-containing protein [Thermoleophilia bacterium]|nr:FAD binding domain-containing protein [Thermoleophilia bacterium]